MRFQHTPRETSGPPVVPVDNVEVQTAANGSWTATVQTTNRQDLGTWNVSSSYAGTSQYQPVPGIVGPVDAVQLRGVR